MRACGSTVSFCLGSGTGVNVHRVNGHKLLLAAQTVPGIIQPNKVATRDSDLYNTVVTILTISKRQPQSVHTVPLRVALVSHNK